LIDITAPNKKRYPSKTTLIQFNDRNPWFGEVFSFHIKTIDEIKSGNLRVMFTLKDFLSGVEAGRVSSLPVALNLNTTPYTSRNFGKRV